MPVVPERRGKSWKREREERGRRHHSHSETKNSQCSAFVDEEKDTENGSCRDPVQTSVPEAQSNAEKTEADEEMQKQLEAQIQEEEEAKQRAEELMKKEQEKVSFAVYL